MKTSNGSTETGYRMRQVPFLHYPYVLGKQVCGTSGKISKISSDPVHISLQIPLAEQQHVLITRVCILAELAFSQPKRDDVLELCLRLIIQHTLIIHIWCPCLKVKRYDGFQLLSEHGNLYFLLHDIGVQITPFFWRN